MIVYYYKTLHVVVYTGNKKLHINQASYWKSAKPARNLYENDNSIKPILELFNIVHYWTTGYIDCMKPNIGRVLYATLIWVLFT